MYDELVKRLRASVDGRYEKCDGCPYEEDYPCCVDCLDKMHKQAADAIEELQKAAMRLEEENGILDELPLVDQSTPCDTCVHKGNVDFDYCHICNNEADMYKPKPPKEE